MAKAMITPAAAAAKWQSRLAQSGDAIRAGVQAVQTSPGQSAAAKSDLWLQNVTASKQRWQDAVSKVNLTDWQNAIINKGIPRIQAGAATAQPKVASFLSQWMPFQQQVVASLPPRGGLEQNIQRMETLVRKNADQKGKFRQTGRTS